MKNLLRKVHDNIFGSYVEELKRETKGCKSILDVGCGVDSPVQYLPRDIYHVGVDIYAPAIEASKQRGIHNEYHEISVDKIEEQFGENSFDCALASDVIEHVTKEQGLVMMEKMERVAKHKIIIFTPRGFIPQDEHDGNPWQVHRSGWEVAEMQKYGYQVIGVSGMKWVWNIKFLWRKRDDANIFVRIIRKILVDFTQLYARNHPEYAYQIMCVKTKNNAK